MNSALDEKVNKIKNDYILFMEEAKASRSHPVHDVGEASATPAKFHQLLRISKDMKFNTLKKSQLFLAHGLLHFLYHKVKNGNKVEGDLSVEDLKNLHSELINTGRISTNNFDELDLK